MKRLSVIGRLVLLFAFALVFQARAQHVNLKTRSTQIGINNEGYFSSIQVEGKDILHTGKYPLGQQTHNTVQNECQRKPT